MLIQFIVKNLFSFFEAKEFNMLPSPKEERLNNHKYQFKNLEILKMSSIAKRKCSM
jgi:hypothetical protein